jgi:Gluconate 2-dehydrogenase subunit 3
MPNRRLVIKKLAAGSAGMLFFNQFHACKSEPGIQLGAALYTSAEMDNLFALSQSILPSIDAEMFTWLKKYLEDCFSPEDQKMFRKGFDHFSKTYLTATPGKFSELSAGQKATVLKSLEEAEQKNQALAFFYKTLKSSVIRSYTGSKYYLTTVQPYTHIPGKYQGCV